MIIQLWASISIPFMLPLIPAINDFGVIGDLSLPFLLIREGLSVQLILHLTKGPETGILPGTTVWCLTGGWLEDCAFD